MITIDKILELRDRMLVNGADARLLEVHMSPLEYREFAAMYPVSGPGMHLLSISGMRVRLSNNIPPGTTVQIVEGPADDMDGHWKEIKELLP